MPKRKALERIIERNSFYQKNLYALIGIGVLLLILSATLLFFINKYSKDYTKPVYFASADDGTILGLLPNYEPNMSDENILIWTKNAVREIYNLGYTSYRADLQEARQYFTVDGYKEFVEALKLSNNLNAIKTRQLVSYAVLDDNSTIKLTKKGRLGGKKNGDYVWVVDLEFDVKYENLGTSISQPSKLTVLVIRQSLLDNPYGVGIAKWIARDSLSEANQEAGAVENKNK